MAIIGLAGKTYAANSRIEFNINNEDYPLSRYFEILDDKDARLTVWDARNPKYQDRYFSVAPKIPDFGFNKDAYWLRFSLHRLIHNEPFQTRLWYLNIAYAHHDLIELYIFHKDKLIYHTKTGRLLPFRTRVYKHENFVLPIKIPAAGQTYTYYIRVSGSASKIIPAKLQNYESLDRENNIKNNIYGFYYGIMFAMIIYNLLMFVSVRRSVYLFYVLYNIFINLLNISESGLSYEYFWPDSIWWNYISIPFFIAMATLSAIFFCYSFLSGIRNRHVRINLLMLRGFGTISVMIAFMCLFIGHGLSRVVMVKSGMILASAFTISMLIISLRMMIKGKGNNFSFFLGWLIFPIAVIFTSLKATGILQYSVFLENILPIGMLFQSFIFSLSLNEFLTRQEARKVRLKEKSLQAISKANSIKNEFLGKTSHELKTPIHGILGISESLKKLEKAYHDPELHNGLSHIGTSARRLLFIINDILDITKLGNKELRIIRKAVNLHDSLKVIIPILTQSLLNQNIKIINKIPPDFPLLNVDENRLQQILINIISNAIKFTSRGRIIIHAQITEPDSICIHIRDTGIGIKATDHERIFEPFEQVDKSLSKSHSGIGLGLSIVKEIMELHGGNVGLKSRPRKGSRFSLIFPLALQDSKGKKTPKSKGETGDNSIDLLPDLNILPKSQNLTRSLSQPHIFIVDDQAINIDVLFRIFKNLDYNITSMQSGKECLDLLNNMERKPDCILLDIMMPDMDGFEVASIIRKQYNLYELPIVMITALNNLESIKKGFEMGANDYITKPFQSDELIARVNTMAKLGQMAKEHYDYIEMSKDMETAIKLQKSILPDEKPEIENIEVDFAYFPLGKIGGDYYDYVLYSENKIGFIIADVSGHGIAAALISSMIKILFSGLKHFANNPKELLSRLNQSLFKKIGNTFITANYLFIDLENNKAQNANAGHPPILHYSHSQNVIRPLMTAGGAIGFIEKLDMQENSVEISKGDRFLLYTDGIVEGYENVGYPAGEEYLMSLMQNCLDLGPNKAKDYILSDFHLKVKEPIDDITLIIVDIR